MRINCRLRLQMTTEALHDSDTLVEYCGHRYIDIDIDIDIATKANLNTEWLIPSLQTS